MHAKAAVTSARLLVGAAAVVCTLFVVNVSAKEKIVAVSVRVSAAGLDLSQPADARTFYTRLLNAARLVCKGGTRVDLVPSDDPIRCAQQALGEAVRAANKPLVTQLYLATHTLQEAAQHGIEIPSQLAAK
jgi:UrcA family protein